MENTNGARCGSIGPHDIAANSATSAGLREAARTLRAIARKHPLTAGPGFGGVLDGLAAAKRTTADAGRRFERNTNAEQGNAVGQH